MSRGFGYVTDICICMCMCPYSVFVLCMSFLCTCFRMSFLWNFFFALSSPNATRVYSLSFKIIPYYYMYIVHLLCTELCHCVLIVFSLCT